MSENQKELFEEFPSAVKPSSHLASFKVGEKIIEVAGSVWKDGRIRADLSEYGAGCPVSRKQDTIVEIIARALRAFFGQAVEAVSEAVSEELEQAHRQRRPSHPRVNNKRCQTEEAGWPKRYINPFEKDMWNFSKAPHWLLVRREPSLGEKLVYARLTYAPREAEGEKICDRKDVSLGVIFGLNQGELAKELGMRRESRAVGLKGPSEAGPDRLQWQPGSPGLHPFLLASVDANLCGKHTTLVRKTHKLR
jgi:hypothetical protein